MATLEEVFEILKDQVKNGDCKKADNGVCYADKILKIPGLKNLTVKVSYGSDGHYFMSVYRGAKITRQITIYADDADDFEIISAFLKKYSDTISKYVVRSTGRRNNAREVEVDLNENENSEKQKEQDEEKSSSKKSSSKSSKSKKVNVEDEF
jgi:hypothetical protein